MRRSLWLVAFGLVLGLSILLLYGGSGLFQRLATFPLSHYPLQWRGNVIKQDVSLLFQKTALLGSRRAARIATRLVTCHALKKENNVHMILL